MPITQWEGKLRSEKKEGSGKQTGCQEKKNEAVQGEASGREGSLGSCHHFPIHPKFTFSQLLWKQKVNVLSLLRGEVRARGVALWAGRPSEAHAWPRA